MPPPVTAESLGRATAQAHLLVEGMGSAHDVAEVRHVLEELDGVVFETVALVPPIASIVYDPTRVTEQDLVAAVSRAGAEQGRRYEPRVLR